MAHAREKIRDAVKAAVTGLPTTKRSVFTSRVHALNDNEMPCLLVFTRLDVSQRLTMKPPRRIKHTLTVLVEGYVKLGADYEEKLDKIGLEVERAIYNNPSLQTLVKDIFLTESESKITGDAEKPVAVITMNFTAEYYTLEDDPETLT